MTIAPDGTAKSDAYWSLRYPPAAQQRSRVADRREAVAHIRRLLTRAVERRLVSDVPLGAFLSGGIDSTIVVGLMAQLTGRPVKTFSIGFEGDAAYDETLYARLASDRFATDHTAFRVAPSAAGLIDKLLWHFDGPFGDSSAIPTYVVSELTREHVTVVLTGDGGDEVFAGYLRFHAALAAGRLPFSAGAFVSAMLSAWPSPNERHWVSRVRRFVRYMRLPLLERLTGWNSFFFDDLEELLAPEFRDRQQPFDRLRHLRRHLDELHALSPLSQLLLANFRTYLTEDLLVKTDRMTMAVGVEARAPFLDRELIEYVASVPDEWKLSRTGRTKVILREAFADLVPAAIGSRPKMGFGVPLDRWLRGELRSYVCDALLRRDARCHAYVRAAQLEILVERHLSGRSNLGQQLWALLVFERWLQLLPEWQQRARTGALQPVA